MDKYQSGNKACACEYNLTMTKIYKRGPCTQMYLLILQRECLNTFMFLRFMDLTNYLQ